MSPDELRQLAYMLETDMGVVALCEAFDAGEDRFTKTVELKNKIDHAQVSGDSLVWLGSMLALYGKSLQEEHEAIKQALTEPEEPLGPDHIAEVVEFRKERE